MDIHVNTWEPTAVSEDPSKSTEIQPFHGLQWTVMDLVGVIWIPLATHRLECISAEFELQSDTGVGTGKAWI